MLTSITIPDSVTSIGSSAFYDTAYYNNNSNWDNGILYIGNHLIEAKQDISGNVEIKQGAKVIADSAFSGCTSLTNIIIPDSVTSIGDSAFSNCTSLISITIPDGVTKIGSGAFYGCTSLTSVTIPDSVTNIGDYAFSDCTSLTNVTIGSGLTNIGDYVFEDCTSLKRIDVSEGNQNYTSVDGVLYNKDKTILIHCPARCEAEAITIPANQTDIDEATFANCVNLKRIDVEEGNQNYASVDGILYNKDKTILIRYPAGRGADESCITPDSVEKIASGAFNGCKAVKELVFPKNLKAIADDVSDNPVKIDTLTVNCVIDGENVNEIFGGYLCLLAGRGTGEFTMLDLQAPREVNLNADVNDLLGILGICCESVNILYDDPDYCTEDGVLYSKDKTTLCKVPCLRIKPYQIPSNVTNIEPGALAECVRLDNIDVAEENKAFCSENGVLFNKEKTTLIAYPAGRTETEYIIIDGVTAIDIYAFGACQSLENVTIPDSVTSIGNQAFSGCTSLKRVYIPDTVTTIGEKSFGYLNDEAIEGFTIIGKSGSAAQTYAEENGFAFVCPESIKVSKLPDKATYFIGDAFDPTGIVVSYVNNDGSEDAINAEFTITGFDSSVAGKNTITVAYDGMTTTFDVEIKTPSIALAESSLAFDRVGATKTLTATAAPSDSEIVWKSSNESVATVENGVVTAKGAGNATITATITVNGIEYSAECAVTVIVAQTIEIEKLPEKTSYYIGDVINTAGLKLKVTYSDGSTKIVDNGFVISGFDSMTAGQKTVTVAYDGMTTTFDVVIKAPEISLSNSNVRFNAIGENTALTATTVPSDSEIVWKSSNESVATVENGVVTAKGAGNATITATITVNGIEYSAECAVTVVLLDSIAVTKLPTKTEYYVGGTLDTTGLEITAKYTDNTEKVIDSDLTITGFDSFVAGKNTVTVAYDGKTATFDVVIKTPSIALSESSLAFDHAGTTKTLTATTVPSDSEIVWKSSNESVATVENGVVIAKGAGNATITATITVNGIEYSAECAVTVVLLDSIAVTKLPTKTEYYVGGTLDTTGLEITAKYTDGSTKIVDNGFVISGFASSVAGKNTITVAYDGKTATFDVVIKAPSIALSESSLAFDLIGKTATLTATTVPSDSEIVWKSSNESVATVENGVVIAKGAGNATITATITVNGIEYSAECAVSVVLLDSIAVTKMPTKTEYYVGGTLDTTGLEITAKYTDNTEKVIESDLTITGFDSSVAGKNTVTVAYDGKTATFDVEIKAPEISLSNSNVRFNAIGETATLTATTIPSDSEIVWKSSNESVATVENGVVTAKGAGNATITATITVNGIEYSAECAVTVVLLGSIAVTKLPTKTEYYVGGTLDTTGLKITATYTDGSTKIVDNGFVISGFASSVAGKSTVTVAYDGKTATFDVEIKAPSIALAESSLAFDHAGTTKTLMATTVPSDSEIVWKSSNDSVATVENGVVTAKGAGNATITATITVNGIEYSAECAVDVKLPTMSFPDVRMGDWYYDAVKYNFERGYITGYSNGTFGPSNNIQRQDFVLILARIAGANLSAYKGQNGGFSDVQAGAYYASAVAWAKDKGIVTGYSADNFGVGTYITREQISLILCRYLGGGTSGNVDAILNAYSDGGNTSPWAKAGVAWAVENGIIGNSDYLNPNGNAGRAEVAQIIYNMSNKGML